jgi:hypothetical protein
MVLLQEELDWECYRVFGLIDAGAERQILADPEIGIDPELRPAFWRGDEPFQQLPPTLKATYMRRRRLLSEVAALATIETPVYKRLWLGQQGVFGHASGTYLDHVSDALRFWLLDRLEDPRHWPQVELISCRRLSDRVRQDSDFVQIAALYVGSADFDGAALVTELVESEAVPFLPVLRYKPSGFAKREVWEQTWDLQRREDAGENVSNIAVPLKYAPADFFSSTFWRLRGKLDVPKERFVSYPCAEGDDDRSLVIGWAGWDHLQQAQALAALYQQHRTVDGWERERLAPLLAGLLELVPWLKQWHNEPNPEFEGERLGDYFERLADGEARSLGLSTDDLHNWRPTKASAKSRAPRRPRKRAEV